MKVSERGVSSVKKPWEGRFKNSTDPGVEQFSASIHFDCRLAGEDIEGSLAHVRALASAGIINDEEAAVISRGLEDIKTEILSGEFVPDPAYEDIHMYIESRLREKIGPVGGKLHSGRSRNDQVALDMHLYIKKETLRIDALLQKLQQIILEMAEKNLGIIMPGYTHLQRAQPVQFSHHLMSYFWMFSRDRERLDGVYSRSDIMPLGAGALAGSGFHLDREQVARELGFSRLYENSMDAVSDRDFLLEFLSFASVCMMHLSRLGEEIILWCSSEFGFIELDDSYTTGSSLMPQKKNPDVAELVRGKTGRVYGSLMSLFTTLKGLPLCYNRDMQEDKEGVFDAVDTLQTSLKLVGGMLQTAEVNREKTEAATTDEFAMATDVADYLVKQGVPFRESHNIVGRMVAYCRENGKQPGSLEQEELSGFHDMLEKDKFRTLLDPRNSVETRSIRGGTATSAVKQQLTEARKILSKKYYSG